MDVVRRALLGTLLASVVLASACASDSQPEPPPSKVSTQEFEHRLDEHLSRFASLLQPDAQVCAPAHSRSRDCDGGPSWAIVPRAKVTVNAGDQALPGTLDDEKSCPYRMQNYLEPLARRLDDDALKQALRPLYESVR